jgi:glucose-6-phosphate dehydrogenase assembly protein OpcA
MVKAQGIADLDMWRFAEWQADVVLAECFAEPDKGETVDALVKLGYIDAHN